MATPVDIKLWPRLFDEKFFYLIVNRAVGSALDGKKVVPEDLPATVKFCWIRAYAECCKTGLSSPSVVHNA